MAFCTSCGSQIEDDSKFCTQCGAILDDAPVEQPAPAPVQPVAPVYTQPVQPQPQPLPQQPAAPVAPPVAPAYVGEDVAPAKGTKYAPLKAGSVLGSLILFSLPIAGFIIMIVWMCCGVKNMNKRALARGLFLYGVVIAALWLIVFGVFILILSSYAGGIDQIIPYIKYLVEGFIQNLLQGNLPM